MFIVAQNFLAHPVIYLRTLSMVYFERSYMSRHLSSLFVSSFDVIIINYKSNLLRKNCIDVTSHVVFVSFCQDIVNVKHCVS